MKHRPFPANEAALWRRRSLDVQTSDIVAGRGPGPQPPAAWARRLDKLIEASREHGTYQIMRQDMDFSGTAKKVELPGNTEIAAATLDYHRVGK